MSLEWKYEKLGKLCSFDKESINPIKDIEYYHYSFPAFDNNKEPEVEMGQDIKSSKFLFNKGDILFNKLNVKFKRVWDIDFDINENSICSTEFIPIQAKHIDRNFLYYCLISPNFTNEMKYLSTGTSNSHQRINPKDIKDYDLFLPIDKEIQRKIGHILKLLDKKISINTEINKNLEQYLFYLFDETFMKFDFNEFSNSSDKIPPTWNIGKFNDIIESLGSGDWGKEERTGNYTSEVYCIRGADIPDVKQGNKGKMPVRFILPKNFKNRKLNENSIVIEISGGSPTQSTGRTVFITNDFLNRFDKDIICTNFCKVINPKENYEIFLYLYLNYLYDKNVMFAYENGTTGIKNFDIKGFFNNFQIVIPSVENIIKFNNLVKDIFDITMHNGLEIEKLQQLRDTLLPKLMSGEIDVSQINCDL